MKQESDRFSQAFLFWSKYRVIILQKLSLLLILSFSFQPLNAQVTFESLFTGDFNDGYLVETNSSNPRVVNGVTGAGSNYIRAKVNPLSVVSDGNNNVAVAYNSVNRILRKDDGQENVIVVPLSSISGGVRGVAIDQESEFLYQSGSGSGLGRINLLVWKNDGTMASVGYYSGKPIGTSTTNIRTIPFLRSGGLYFVNGAPARTAYNFEGNVRGLAFDAQGNLYMANSGDHRVDKVSILKKKVSATAGTGNSIVLENTNGLKEGDLVGGLNIQELSYIGAVSGNTITLVSSSGAVRNIESEVNSGSTLVFATGITNILGNGTSGSVLSGVALTSQLDFTTTVAADHLQISLVFDISGNLYVADMGNKRILKIHAESGAIGGNSPISVFVSKTPETDQLRGMAIGKGGNLYFTNTNNHTVYSVKINALANADEQGDDGTPHPTGLFDYSGIKDHPRILFSKADEEELKNILPANADLTAVHNRIITYCNSVLTANPVEWELTGKRLLSVSRLALKRIFYLSYAYRMTGDNRYLVRAEQEINAVCDFTDWNPSHFLDIGEMATGVAIGYDWLYHNLSIKTKDNIRKALKEKAFQPSYNSSYAWFLTASSNWNQVCNTGLTYAALAIYESNKQEAVNIIERAHNSIKLPLATYVPSGNYPEGYMYWAYGTTYQVMFSAALESALGTDGNLQSSPGFMQTANYMLYMAGTNGLCFNYADCYNNESPNPAMFWFAHKANDPRLIFNERRLIENGGLYIKTYEEERLLPLALMFGMKHDFSQQSAAPSSKMYVGYGDVPVAMVRTGWGTANDIYVGIKGGYAGANHGHMDAGSFVFETKGIRWALDLGLQSYNTLESKGVDLWNMSQNSQRWDVLRLNNNFHNTLTINGNKHLVNGKATITEIFDADAKRGARLKLTDVFKNDLRSAEREIVLINEDYLLVTDQVSTNNKAATFKWKMVTKATPEIIDNSTIKLSQEGKIVYLKINSSQAVQAKTWSTAPVTDYDAENPGSTVVGFESSLAANHDYTFEVKIGSNLNN
ncbi:heparinase II/III domain-containing protein [Pseudopedobacter beijingensis]|uniref:Heparinase II/III family protein n=1 Tax=Pseudopedobacter beijingensis TaxID=1207056 RepID=A0ABW4IC17_9SPHI